MSIEFVSVIITILGAAGGGVITVHLFRGWLQRDSDQTKNLLSSQIKTLEAMAKAFESYIHANEKFTTEVAHILREHSESFSRVTQHLMQQTQLTQKCLEALIENEGDHERIIEKVRDIQKQMENMMNASKDQILAELRLMGLKTSTD